MFDRSTCEHGIKPWWDCDKCRSTSKIGVTGLAESGALYSEKPLVLGENLLPDGTVRT